MTEYLFISVVASLFATPFVAAARMGIQIAAADRIRINPLVDGFGLIAFASLTPMIFVMAYGIIWFN